MVVGLLADPGLSSKLSADLVRTLPKRLAQTDGRVEWRVETTTHKLPLDEHGTLPAVQIGQRAMAEHGRHLVVLVTGLPRRAGTQPIVSDYGVEAGVGLMSLAALGAMELRRRAREVTAHLIAEHLAAKPLGVHRGDGHGPPAPRQAQDRRLGGFGPPVEHIDSTDKGIDGHLALTGTRGRLRLLTGMVRANRPWRLLPSLSPALAGAAAGAAFGIFYSNIWELGDSFSTARLALVNVLAVLVLIVWLIIDNNLWERPRNQELHRQAALFNAVTALTITIAAVCMYVLLYAVALVSAFIVIPPDYLSSTLKHPAGVVAFRHRRVAGLVHGHDRRYARVGSHRRERRA